MGVSGHEPFVESSQRDRKLTEGNLLTAGLEDARSGGNGEVVQLGADARVVGGRAAGAGLDGIVEAGGSAGRDVLAGLGSSQGKEGGNDGVLHFDGCVCVWVKNCVIVQSEERM